MFANVSYWLSTLLKNLWQWLLPRVFLGMTLQAWNTCILGVSSLKILSSSVRLGGECCCTAIFRSLQRLESLIGFKSGLWLGHSRTFRDLSWSHSCVVLVVCLGLSCWRWTFAPVWGPECSGAGFHQGSLCTLLRSSLPRSWLVSRSLPLKNIPTAWCCHHRGSP